MVEGLTASVSAMQQAIDKKFDAMQQAIDKKFDAMQQASDKKFDAMQQASDKKFDAMQQASDKKFDAMQQASDKKFDDVQQAIDTKFDDVQQRLGRIENNQGHLFEVGVRATPPDQLDAVLSYDELPLLLHDSGLPGSAEADVLRELVQPDVLYKFRDLLAGELAKSKRKALKAALASWQALPAEPSSAAEWSADAAQASKVLRALRSNTPLHSAMLLWRACCVAASEDAAAGTAQASALLRLAATTPKVMWPPASTLLVAVAGGVQSSLDLDTRLVVEQDGQGVTLSVTAGEVKMSGAEAAAGARQLTRAISALGWLYAAAGKPLPKFIGSVIVPNKERRQAERAWPPREEVLELPQGRGTVIVDWRVRCV